jgi:hypothetical protein
MSNDAPIRDHKAWLGYVQQDRLVLLPTALVDAQVVLDRNTLFMQEGYMSEAALSLKHINRQAARQLKL